MEVTSCVCRSCLNIILVKYCAGAFGSVDASCRVIECFGLEEAFKGSPICRVPEVLVCPKGLELTAKTPSKGTILSWQLWKPVLKLQMLVVCRFLSLQIPVAREEHGVNRAAAPLGKLPLQTAGFLQWCPLAGSLRPFVPP